MPRSVNSSTLTSLQQDAIRLAHLVRIDLDTQLFLTDYSHEVSYLTNRYIPASHLLSFDATQETQELRVGTVTINISGVDQAYISFFLNQQYMNRRVRIWLAILNSAGQIIGDPIKTFDGEITGYSLQESRDSCVINMKVASHWADFERKTGRLTNNNSQQYFFPTDTGMRFAADSIKDIKWGKA